MPKKTKTRKRRRATHVPAVPAAPLRKRQSLFLLVLPWFVTVLVLIVWVMLAYRTYSTARSPVTVPGSGTTKENAAPVTENTNQKKTFTFAETSAKLPSSANILVVGDVMLGRYVETLMKKNGNDYPFVRIQEKVLKGHDLVIGNLEGPIDTTHTQTPDSSLLFSFSPAVATILAQQKFSAMSLANNHSLDQGAGGIQDSRDALRKAGIDPVGHPQDITVANAVIKTIDDTTVAIIAFHATQSSFSLDDAITVIQDISLQRPNAFVLVYPHWGTEYQAFSNSRQQALAHAFIDAGADAVLGHHPHVVEEAEVYKDHLIVYSLGNFIFDQYFSVETQQELAVDITIEEDRVSYRFVPLISENSQPQLMDTAETKAWLGQYAEQSNILDLADGTLELIRSKENL